MNPQASSVVSIWGKRSAAYLKKTSRPFGSLGVQGKIYNIKEDAERTRIFTEFMDSE
jgi:hypothetical protein